MCPTAVETHNLHMIYLALKQKLVVQHTWSLLHLTLPHSLLHSDFGAINNDGC